MTTSTPQPTQSTPTGSKSKFDQWRYRLTRSWEHRFSPVRPRVIAGLGAYSLWGLLLARSMFGGEMSRAILLMRPVVLLVAHLFPQAALLASIPAAAFGNVLMVPWLSLNAYALVVAVAGLGVVTRRWKLIMPFHGVVILLATTVVVSAFTNDAIVGGLSVRPSALYTAMGLSMMIAASLIRPRIDQVLLAIACTGALVGVTVLAGWFRQGDTPAEGQIQRVYALGLNPNYLGLLVAFGSIAGVAVGLERRQGRFVLLALPCLLAMPSLKSRTALLLVGVGFLWMLLRHSQRRLRDVIAVGLVFALVSIMYASLGTLVYRAVLGRRATVSLSSTDQFRRDVARFAFEQGLRHPVAGVGFGQFSELAGTRFAIAYPSAHNDFLRYFAELGGFGLGLLLTLIVLIARAARSAGAPRVATPMLAIMIVPMLLAETLSSLPTLMGPVILAGAVVGAARRKHGPGTNAIGSRPPSWNE